MCACVWAAVHLGKDYEDRFLRAAALLSITQNQIHSLFKEEVFGVKTIDWDRSPWKKITLANENVLNLLVAKVHVFSDSVLCLDGKCQEYPQSVKHGKTQSGGLPTPLSIVSWTVNQSFSSGRFSQGAHNIAASSRGPE